MINNEHIIIRNWDIIFHRKLYLSILLQY